MNKETGLDLTEGNVRTKLIRYAIPMVVMSLLQSLYSMADLIISGHFIGSRGISGINNASQIMLLVTQIIIGLSQGGNILIGQYYGAKQERSRKETTNTLFFSFMSLAVIVAAGLFFLSGTLLTALKAPAYREALAYLKICSVGVLFIFGYNSLVAAVRAVGDSRRPMRIIMISTGVNIVLDLLFVGVFSMGTGGAALATVIAQGISFFLMLTHVLKNRDFFGVCLWQPQIYGKQFLSILKLGIPCAVQQSLAGISWLTVTRFINGYGVAASAGSGISAKIKEFSQLFLVAIANSTTTMVAQNLGAEKYDRVKEVVHTAIRFSMMVATILIVFVEIAAPLLVGIFTQSPEVANVAVLNIRIEIIGQIFYAIFLVYHCFAIGAGHTMFSLGSSFVNCILVRVVLVVILNHVMGLPGIFLACMIAPSSSVPLGLIYEKSNVWRKRLTT
ncbi:MAG: MATE family efflux transporter [Hespellia sp.]|nr:MATE family efflux transporter [Hespellia sp.]